MIDGDGDVGRLLMVRLIDGDVGRWLMVMLVDN